MAQHPCSRILPLYPSAHIQFTVDNWDNSSVSAQRAHRCAVVVRDPPRERLPPSSVLFSHESQATSSPVPDVYSASFASFSNKAYSAATDLSYCSEEGKMAKKRRSLQSILVPSFLQVPSSPTSPTSPTSYMSRMRSQSIAESSSLLPDSSSQQSSTTPNLVKSPRDSPPPDFLLDDDPFANLTFNHIEIVQSSTKAPLTPPLSSDASIDAPPKPRSPLSPSSAQPARSPPSSPKATQFQSQGIPRAFSSGRIQPRHAHQRPAFVPRPSLPSLYTLARTNVVFTKKVRRGRVGAGLPFEPWDNLENGGRTSGESSSGAETPSDTSDSSSKSSTFRASYASQSAPPDADAFPGLADTQLLTSLSILEDGLSFSQGSSSVLSDFVTDLDGESFDFAEGHSDFAFNSESSRASSHAGDSHHSELPYVSDDSDIVDFSAHSLASSEISELPSNTLARSISSASTSSSGSSCVGDLDDTHHQHSFYGITQTSSSAESELDIPHSPPDDCLSFSTRYSLGFESEWEDRFGIETNPTPHNTMILDHVLDGRDWEPGTSVETIRAALIGLSDRAIGERHSQSDHMIDAHGWEGYRGGSQQNYDYSNQKSSPFSNRGMGNYTRGSSTRGHGNGDDEDDRRDDKRRNMQSSFLTPSSSEPNSSEDEDSADEYGKPSARTATTRFPVTPGADSNSDDDDVPLAQRIPTALTAQKSIRKQVREERDQKRRDRAARTEARSRQTTLRPAGAGNPTSPAAASSSQEAAMHAAQAAPRKRTQTLPGNTQPFAPEDLAKKLQSMQVAETPTPTRHDRSPSLSRPSKEHSHRPRSAGHTLRDDSFGRHMFHVPQSPPPVITNPLPEGTRMLRPMRSFHRSERRQTEDNHAVPMPAGAEQKGELGRSLTRVRSRHDPQTQTSFNRHPRSLPSNQSAAEEPPIPKVPRLSEDQWRVVKPQDTRPARTSADAERPQKSIVQRLPPLAADIVGQRPQIIQQRIFIGNMQRFNLVEIGPSTNAGEVIEMIEAQGTLEGWAGSGGWMIWEVAQDFGMERPVRNFESLIDIQASWNKDKTVNTFVLKLTPLAVPLSRSAIPSSSPKHSGYVEWEAKRGKWNKRWMELREHSIWLAKRNNGKDEVFLCSLSNFDAYHITRSRRAPKQFIFAVKSTDNLSFFENTADYLHVFSCNEKDGKEWMEKILVARSYVLHQERHVLFNPKVAGGNAASTSNVLSRSGTRKANPLVRPNHAPPLGAGLSHIHANDVFEPGSLLHKQL